MLRLRNQPGTELTVVNWVSKAAPERRRVAPTGHEIDSRDNGRGIVPAEAGISSDPRVTSSPRIDFVSAIEPVLYTKWRDDDTNYANVASLFFSF